MPQDLSCDVALGVNFDAHASHFKWRDMLVFEEIAQELRSRLPVVFVSGIANTRHFDDELFSVGRCPDQFNLRSHL